MFESILIIWISLLVGCELYTYQVYGKNLIQSILDVDLKFVLSDYIAISILYAFTPIYFYIIMEDSKGEPDEY